MSVIQTLACNLSVMGAGQEVVYDNLMFRRLCLGRSHENTMMTFRDFFIVETDFEE